MAVSRMVVVGWDGATFDLIGPWIAEGKLPTFARLLGRWCARRSPQHPADVDAVGIDFRDDRYEPGSA